jgi:hypothetical protein
MTPVTVILGLAGAWPWAKDNWAVIINRPAINKDLIDFIVNLSLNEFLKMQCEPNLKNYFLFRFYLFFFYL